MFSIIIPTFNNVEYLKLCISSIEKNSKFEHEIIPHINEGADGTEEYLISKQEFGLEFGDQPLISNKNTLKTDRNPSKRTLGSP